MRDDHLQSKSDNPSASASDMSTIREIFTSDNSIWWKMLGGAVATPLVVRSMMNRAARRGGTGSDFTNVSMAWILLGSVALGAVLGGLLTAKDVVQRRRANGNKVAWPWVLLFGMGLISAVLIWMPLVIVLTLAAVVLMLGPAAP